LVDRLGDGPPDDGFDDPLGPTTMVPSRTCDIDDAPDGTI
jgi:hypothetical protein